MGAPIIQVRNLTVRFDTHTVLEDVSLDVMEGEILAILGGSGCGKSTLLRHMVGLRKPQGGSVYIGETDIAACDEEEFQTALRKIGVLFQSAALFGSMSLAENVALPITAYAGLPPASVRTLVRMKLCMVDLEDSADRLPSEISGGMKKRAGLARAMALNPRILFLDEPSAGLDPVTSAEIDALIRHINRNMGTTMVVVTHELDSILSIAQRVVMLDKSKKGVIAEGDPRHLKDHSDNPMVREFFNPRSRQEKTG